MRRGRYSRLAWCSHAAFQRHFRKKSIRNPFLQTWVRRVAHSDRSGEFAAARRGNGDGIRAWFVNGQIGRLVARTPLVGAVFTLHFEGGE